MADWIGRTLFKVEIQKLLGRGGLTEVYLGRHTTLNRPVVVKILFSHFADHPDLLDRFEREARAAGRRDVRYIGG
jgi:serine/threonine-protein kinase